MRILIFDTETSGLNPQWNVILQLSYQIVDSDTWVTYKTVNHYFPWPENRARVSQDAIEVNGLTEEALSGKHLSDKKAALEEFVEDKDFCDLLVAHNLEFDKKFIIASCREEGVKFASSGWSKSYDTMKGTTSFCQIPKDWGKGYKLPKLTELADCLFIDYSNIPLHDSSGDVELTKLCFKQIVAEGLYSLPKESDITIILHVESPDNLQFEIRKNGELIDELILTGIYGVSKKTLNAARQELIRKWSDENNEERNSLIQIYRKSPRIKEEKDFREEIDEIKPKKYVRKVFDEQPPSKDEIQKRLELEAEQEISSWMFWTLKKKRQEYVNSRLEQDYQKQLDLYNQRFAEHEKFEDKAEEEYDKRSEEQCEERKRWLTALIEGKDIALLEKELLRVPDLMSPSFPCHIESTLNDTTIDIELLLPQSKDLPHLEGVRLASGNYKIKEISDKNKKIDYSNWVWGISFYVAAYYFNISPRISKVEIKGYVKTEDFNNLDLYVISFDRNTYSSLNLENMEIDTALSHFNATNKMTKDVLDKLFVAKEDIKYDTKKAISPTDNSRFSKEAVDLWGLTTPLTSFEDEFEIWEANFYTVYKTLGSDFTGSIFGYVEPRENEDYKVQYASGRYKLNAFTPKGEPIQNLDAIADKYVQWVGLSKCPFVGYVYKKTETSLPEGVVWIIAPKSREQVLSSAAAFYKRRKKKKEIPNIIDLTNVIESSNSIGKITDSSSFVPLRKRKNEGKMRLTATKKRIEEYRATAPEVTDYLLIEAIKAKYGDFFTNNEEVSIEAIKETYRNELPLTLENVMQQLGYLVEDRKLLNYYTELQHIYTPEHNQ